MKRILLTKEDFETLVSGKIAEQDGVQIALQDIGYEVMFDIIEKLTNELYARQNHKN